MTQQNCVATAASLALKAGSRSFHAEVHFHGRASGKTRVEPDAFGRLRQLDGGKTLQPFVVRDALLSTGQIGAGTEMSAAAKCDVLSKLGAIVVERGRTGEFAFVAIGAGGAQEDLGALLDDYTPQLDVFAREPMG